MALIANREVDHFVDQELRSFQVAASKHIYKGGFVGLAATGYVRPLTASDKFVGIAYEETDNSTGASGDLSVRLFTIGDFGHALSGAVTADIGRPVFAAADDTLTFTAIGNSYAGTVQDVVTSGEIILRMDTAQRPVKTITHSVEDLAAGADAATRAVYGFEADGRIVGTRIVNQATAAAGIDASNTCVITLATGAGTVVTETFDATTIFPAANASKDLGVVANTSVSTGDVLTLMVTNGATADPGPFLVLVDYI